MIWIELLAIGLIIGIAFLESHRGFGMALFDLIGALLGVKLVIAFTPAIAEAVPLGQSEQAAQGLWLVILFTVFAALVVLASRIIQQTALLSMDYMDPIVGGLIGIASGIIASHVVLRAMVIAWADTPFGKQLVETLAVRQLVEFQWYLRIFEALSRLGQG